MKHVLNIAFLFDGDTQKALENYSQELARLMPGPYILGVNSLPHVTVLQFLTKDTPESIWKKISALPLSVPSIRFQTLYFEPGRSTGRLWYGIGIQLTAAWIALQKTIIDAVQPDAIINGIGASYQPHATFGGADMRDTLPAMALNIPLIFSENIMIRIALGQSGPNLQFEKILFEKT